MLIALIVLSNIFKLSVFSSILVSNTSLIAPASSAFTKFIPVLKVPIKTLINEVIMKTTITEIRIFPSLLGCFIFPIEVVIVKNIKGTIIVSSRLINKSPNGLNTFAFSPNIRPTIIPITQDNNNMIVDL